MCTLRARRRYSAARGSDQQSPVHMEPFALLSRETSRFHPWAFHPVADVHPASQGQPAPAGATGQGRWRMPTHLCSGTCSRAQWQTLPADRDCQQHDQAGATPVSRIILLCTFTPVLINYILRRRWWSCTPPACRAFAACHTTHAAFSRMLLSSSLWHQA